MRQADVLARLLHLRPGMRLLDLGSGRGWPGLYLTTRYRCQTVLSDVPAEGLRRALARADTEDVADRVAAVASSARDLPFRADSFDAIVHTDVLR
jgi:cyclopropane fatty-acyl-phospholipid synthase-like methyltransferase